MPRNIIATIGAIPPLAATAAMALGLVLSAPAQALHKGGHPSQPNGDGTSTLSGLQCAEDEIAKSDGSGGWFCAEDADSNALGALDCADGDFARLDPTSGEWECLSLVELKLALGLTKTVFVTSGAYTGDLVGEASDMAVFDPSYGGSDGLEAGDFICNAHADAAGLPGDYVAWLSSSAVDAKDRLTPGSGPFLKVNGDLVANDIDDLTDGTIASPIDIDEDGSPAVGTPPQAWTGTSGAGVATTNYCADWTVDGGSLGTAGTATLKDDGFWTNHVSVTCAATRYLYCFQQ